MGSIAGGIRNLSIAKKLLIGVLGLNLIAFGGVIVYLTTGMSSMQERQIYESTENITYRHANEIDA